MSGTLYLAATPIGNLGDVSARLAQTLRSVDFIAAEDTRVTRVLLSHLDIKKPLVSYYEHNKSESGEKIIARLLSGESCALVTDAGMPAVSDPGEELVRACAASGVPVIAIPGPCAAVTALALSALPTGRFTFEGFLSTARKNRFTHLEELKTERRTMIFYEAPHKLQKTLADMLSVFGDRRVSISRELTKIYEETIRCTLSEAVARFGENAPRGEFVLVVDGYRAPAEPETGAEDAAALALRYEENGMTLRDAVKMASAETGVPKNSLYSTALKLKNKSPPAPGGD